MVYNSHPVNSDVTVLLIIIHHVNNKIYHLIINIEFL